MAFFNFVPMTKADLFENITKKQSYLCVGLDTDINKIPAHLHAFEDPVYQFNKQIIDAVADYCVAFKLNTAFYEASGIQGWNSLQKTLAYIPKDIFTIADAKRGDIGNTSSLYARAFFDKAASGFDFDAVTVAPYMGADSVQPFLSFPGKWVILLALTSNEGSQDFQTLKLEGGKTLFETVLGKSQAWGSTDQLMYVVGATQAAALQKVRQLVPDHFLLIPGVGAQGGSLEEVSRQGMNRQCGLLVNASRSIIYASSGDDFALAAKKEAQKMQQEMLILLKKYLKGH